MPDRILLLEQEPEAGLIAHALDEAGFGVARAGNDADLLGALRAHTVAAIVVGHHPPCDDGFAVLQRLREHRIAAPVLMVSPLASTEVAVRAVKAGAHDFVEQCGEYLPHLVTKMRAALAEVAAHTALARVVRPVFVGRNTELRVLGEELGRALAGEGRVVLIAGEEGIGKTSLALELTRVARARAIRVLWGRCPEAGTAPAYWPWTQVLRRHAAAVDGETLRREIGEDAAAVACIVPSLLERHPQVPARAPAEITRLQITDGVTQFLKRVAAAQPLVVVFDDLHRADGDSLHLVQALATECAETSIFLLGTYRDVGADERPELAAIARQPLTTILHLEGFDAAEVRHFVERATTLPTSAALAGAIHAKTEGHPLFVAEVTRLLAAEGRLVDPPPNGELRLAIPSTRRNAIAARLARLSDDARPLLAVAAVLGFDFTPALLARVTAGKPADVQRALDEAIAADLLATSDEQSGAYRFAHVLVRDVLYEGLAAEARTHWHATVAATLELDASPLTRETTLTAIAHHALRAVSDEAGLRRAFTWVTAVAEHAAAMMAHGEAARYYETAVTLSERAPFLGTAATIRLLLQLAEARWRNGDMQDARTIGHRALALAKQDGAPEAIAAAALAFAGRLPGFGAIVCDAEVVSALEQALALLPKTAPLRALVMGRLAAELAYSPRRTVHQTLAQQAIELARASGDETTLAAVLRTTQWSIWTPTCIERRPDLATEIVACAERTGDRVLGLDGHLLRLWSALEQGDVDAAWQQLALCERSAAALHLPHYAWVIAAARACMHFATGQLDEAERLAERASAIGAGAGTHDPSVALLLGAQRAQVRTMQGRFGEVIEWLRDVVTKFPVLAATHECSALVFYARTGQHERVRTELAALAADGFVRVSDNALWLMNVTSLATACVLVGDRDAAPELYRLLAPFTPYNVVVPPAFVLAPVAFYVAGLADLMENGPAARRHYEDALALAGQTGSRQWTARIQVAYARLLLAARDAGERERGARLLAAGRAIAVELGLQPAVQEADAILATASRPEPEPAIFRPAGDVWELAFRGRRATVPSLIGLTYLHCLLQRPGVPIAALELASLGGDAVLVEGGGGARLDRRAVSEVQRRLAEIDAALAAGDRRGVTTSFELLHERAECTTYLGGRATELVSASDRARSGVTKAIRRAVRAIREVHEALGHHLERHVETGRLCVYVPDPAAPSSFAL